MPYLLVRHKVEDYAKWKPLFDEHAEVRKSMTSKGGFVFRNADNPNEVFVLIEVEDLDTARQFTQSDELRTAMEKSGVIDQPDVFFLNEEDRPPV